MKYKNSTFHFLTNGERNLSKAAETKLFLAPSSLFSYNSDFKQSFPSLPRARNLKHAEALPITAVTY